MGIIIHGTLCIVFFSIVWWNHPQEQLTNFGYRPKRISMKLNFIYFCNILQWKFQKKILQNLMIVAHFSHCTINVFIMVWKFPKKKANGPSLSDTFFEWYQECDTFCLEPIKLTNLFLQYFTLLGMFFENKDYFVARFLFLEKDLQFKK